MTLRTNFLPLFGGILLLVACSGESDDTRFVIPQVEESIDLPTTVKTTSTVNLPSTTTYSLVEVENNEPEFLYEEVSTGELSTDWRGDLLAELRIAEPDFETLYIREEWGPGWIDENYNCISTRHEVLIEESLEEVALDERGCKVIEGKWYDYYLNKFLDDPSDLDIDHMVPLHNAHVSGASHWPLETKISFYNDLNDPQHLIAVSSSANRSKGSRGPEVWRPENQDYWCQYAYSWIEIKARWNLSVSDIEFDALEEMLTTCEGLPELTYWFSNWLLRKGAMSSQEMSPTENEQVTESEESYVEDQ
ncbi:MAG: hypothetical protein CL881_07100 [Dehalococcoidia bacterium]|nr:hypothetical protein [Dehalococcoidia bacterium]